MRLKPVDGADARAVFRNTALSGEAAGLLLSMTYAVGFVAVGALSTALVVASVAMVLRPAGFSETGSTRGVHWHIDMDVEYSSTDRRSQKIEVVTVTDKSGQTTEYDANHEVTNAAKVQADHALGALTDAFETIEQRYPPARAAA